MIQRLEDYIEKHEGGLITAIRNDTENTMDNRLTITRKQKWEEKLLYGHFKRLNKKKWTWLRKGNFKKETESLLIATQNNTIRTNHIKARTDKTQQNCKCGNTDETINRIISECSKLAQKEYNTRHDWVSKVIHWEMFKKLKFDHTNQWYMHSPESVLENDTHKLLWDFGIQTDHLISARWPNLIIINNNNNKKRKLAQLRTLLSRPTTEENWKNVKRRIITWTLLGKWKKYGTWRWQLYQLWLVLFVL